MLDIAAQTRRRRRTTAVSFAVLAVIALVITGFAVKYPGLSPSEVDVSNGGVWVRDEAAGLVARVNVDAGELDARLTVAGEDLEIIQDGYTVLLIDARWITPVNTASVQRDPLVDLTPGSTVRLGHDRVAIASPEGKVWILSPGQVPGFSPAEVEPAYTTGGSAAEIVVGSDGTVFVLDGTTLMTFPHADDPGRTTAAEPAELDALSTAADQVQLSVVGNVPVLLDAENSMLRLGVSGMEHDLAADGIGSLDDAELQQAGPAADDVVLATESALVRVPLAGGEARESAAGAPGTPVPPAQVGSCAYGAWTQSNLYVRACDGAEAMVASVPDADSSADLALRVNRGLVVLNDQGSGLSWKIAEDMELVDEGREDKGTGTGTVTLDMRQEGETPGPQAAADAVTTVQVGGGWKPPVEAHLHASLPSGHEGRRIP
ncbi:hypothetical protein [Brachybacterium tyrofermentans]|uniref:hypothetical protein n=1 Tax=Brachybacterium tyrofermentans TaxID=47848 RepID=UPI003FD2CDAC